jgi:hypothetical protein
MRGRVGQRFFVIFVLFALFMLLLREEFWRWNSLLRTNYILHRNLEIRGAGVKIEQSGFIPANGFSDHLSDEAG